jgi:hypothetical protein
MNACLISLLIVAVVVLGFGFIVLVRRHIDSNTWVLRRRIYGKGFFWIIFGQSWASFLVWFPSRFFTWSWPPPEDQRLETALFALILAMFIVVLAISLGGGIYFLRRSLFASDQVFSDWAPSHG